MGALVSSGTGSHRYLAESIRTHPVHEGLRKMMKEAGPERVEYFNMTGGVVLHRRYKL